MLRALTDLLNKHALTLILAPIAVFCFYSLPVYASTQASTHANTAHRSMAERARFMRANPCPASVPHKKTSCPGYVVDHIIALCAGGQDKASNMQYQSIAQGKAKDRVECKKPSAK